MSKSKRFQSGREIFQEFIPGFEDDEKEYEDSECQGDGLVENLLEEFSRKVERAAAPPSRRNA